MQKFLIRLECAVLKLPGCLCRIEHDQSTKHVCLYKNFRVADASVYMALCCEMNHTVNVIFIEDLVDCLAVADICPYKCIIVTVLHIS